MRVSRSNLTGHRYRVTVIPDPMPRHRPPYGVQPKQALLFSSPSSTTPRLLPSLVVSLLILRALFQPVTRFLFRRIAGHVRFRASFACRSLLVESRIPLRCRDDPSRLSFHALNHPFSELTTRQHGPCSILALGDEQELCSRPPTTSPLRVHTPQRLRAA